MTLISLIVLYYKYIPLCLSHLYLKIKDNDFFMRLHGLFMTYKIKQICNCIIVVGDLFCDLCQLLLMMMLTKISSSQLPPSNQIEKIDEYMDDEQFNKINQELDNMLKVGSDILTQTFNGNKQQQLGAILASLNTLTEIKKTV